MASICICGSTMIRQPFSKNFEINLCGSCGTEHFSSCSGIDTREYDYSSMDEKYGNEKYLHGAVFRWAHKQILKLPWRGKTIVEVGCFNGFFMDALRKEGADVYGVELNERAIEVGETEFGLSGRLYNSITDVDLHQKIDSMVLIDVLEHLDDPYDFIRYVKSHVDANEIIVAGPIKERRFHDKSDFPPHHKWRFSTRGLESFFTRNGYVLAERKYEHDMGLLLRNVVGRVLSRSFSGEFYGSGVTLNKADSFVLWISQKLFSFIFWVPAKLLSLKYCSAVFVFRK